MSKIRKLLHINLLGYAPNEPGGSDQDQSNERGRMDNGKNGSREREISMGRERVRE